MTTVKVTFCISAVADMDTYEFVRELRVAEAVSKALVDNVWNYHSLAHSGCRQYDVLVDRYEVPDRAALVTALKDFVGSYCEHHAGHDIRLNETLDDVESDVYYYREIVNGKVIEWCRHRWLLQEAVAGGWRGWYADVSVYDKNDIEYHTKMRVTFQVTAAFNIAVP